MRRQHLLFAPALLAFPAVASAQVQPVPPPARQQLSGLDAAEARVLTGKLQEAQRRLQRGDFQPFELLAGSIASYRQTGITPRDAFLQVPFDKVWNIAKSQTDNPLWRPYRLSYAPDGLGNAYWDIEVVIGADDNIAKVTMLFRPPAPF